MSPRSVFVVMLMLSAFTYSYGQTDEVETTEDPEVTTVPSAAPTTTTTAPPASSVAPTTPPAKTPRGSWNVTDGDRTCIQTKMGIQLNFQYNDTMNQMIEVSYNVPIGNDTKLDGSCGSSDTADESMELSFFENDAWKLSLTFKYDGGDKNWAITDVSLAYVVTAERFPNTTVNPGTTFTASLVNETFFQTRNGSSYQCVSEFNATGFSTAATAPVLTISTTELIIEAFRTLPTPTVFSTPIPCPADTKVSNIVPIAVGAALAALVVIVLVAYLIGRKKNKRGYESV